MYSTLTIIMKWETSHYASFSLHEYYTFVAEFITCARKTERLLGRSCGDLPKFLTAIREAQFGHSPCPNCASLIYVLK